MGGADLYVVAQTAPYTLSAVNLPGLTSTSGDGTNYLADADLGWAAEVFSGEHDGTEATTAGLRGACAASYGWYWDRGTGEFDSGTGVEAVAFGGTFHQDLPAAARYDEVSACTEGWSTCPDHCVEYEREWTSDPPTFADAAAGLQPTADAWMDADAGMSPLGAGYVDAVYDCAMAPTGGSSTPVTSVLVVGGRESEGSSGTADVWTSDGAVYSAPATYGARFGASVVYDVVSQRNYIFGGTLGTSASEAVFRVTSPESAGDNNQIVYSMGDVDLTLDQLAGRRRARGAAFYVDVDCLVSPCRATSFDVVVPTAMAGEIASLEILVALDGGAALDLSDRVTVAGTADWGDEQLSAIRVSLPFVITHDATLSVAVEWADDAVERASFPEILASGGASWTAAPSGSLGTERQAGMGLAAWLKPAEDFLGGGTVHVDSLQVTTLSGFLPIAAGERDEPSPGTFTFSQIDATIPNLPVLLLDGGQELAVTTSALSHPVYAFSDAPLASDVRREADVYLAGDFVGDLAWIESNVGQLSRPWSLVFLAPYPNAHANPGITAFGMSTVGVGVAPAALLRVERLREVALHEFAHQWFGMRRTVGDEAQWLSEGLCTLVMYERSAPPAEPLFPQPNLSDEVTRGFKRLLTRGGARSESDLEQVAKYWASAANPQRAAFARDVQYAVSTYTLAQLHAIHVGHGGTRSAFWSAFGALFSMSATELEAPDVKATLDALDGPSDWFYTEWVADGRLGAPIVSFDSFIRTPAVADASSPTGEWAAPGARVDVAQVQDRLYGWATFSEAPYALLCASSWHAGAPFSECSGTASAPGSTVRVLAGREVGVILTEVTAATGGSGGLPADLYVLANHALWPAALDANLGAAHRQQLCALFSTLSECTADLDADGWPDAADCRSFDPFVYPGVAELTPHVGMDENCDGFTCRTTRGTQCQPVEP